MYSESPGEGLFGDVGVRGKFRTIFFRKLAVTVDGLGFFCLFWSGFRHTALHHYPYYSNIWAYEGQVIWVYLFAFDV